MIPRIYLQNKEQQLFVAFSHTFFVFIAPNLVYLHTGSVNGTSVLLHLSQVSVTAHIWSYKGSK